MPQPKFQLYKHIKISGKWRYCRAAIYSNGKVKLHVVVVCGPGREARRRLLMGCEHRQALGTVLSAVSARAGSRLR